MTLACSPLAALTTDDEPDIRPTRTPFPTFTPTSEQAALLIPAPTETPVPQAVEPTPVPTDTPVPAEASGSEGGAEGGSEGEAAPAEESEPTPVPTEVPTDTPVPPTDTPVPAPTQPPPPTEPPPPAGPVVGPNGVLGQITFRDGRNTYGVGEKVFVRIEATLPDGGQKSFGVLGLTTSTGAFQTSWSSGNINGTFTHEDGLPFNAPGNHKMWLSICFSSESECKAGGNWERFEPGLDVIIQ